MGGHPTACAVERSTGEGAAARAQGWFRDAITLASELGMKPELAHCHDELADVLRRTGRRAEARVELAQALELYRSAGMLSDTTRAAATLASVA